jgi:hypothetical protein
MAIRIASEHRDCVRLTRNTKDDLPAACMHVIHAVGQVEVFYLGRDAESSRSTSGGVMWEWNSP